MKRTLFILSGIVLVMGTGCATAPEKKVNKDILSLQTQEAISDFKTTDPTIDRFFNESYGYAVFPKIAKGAFWVGGAFGRGEVFEQSQMVGYSSKSQATLGFSFGGQYFREIVFFKDKSDLDKFKAGRYTFNAQVTGVALTAGVAAKASFNKGIAVFVKSEKGLMVDVSLGGQKFKYVPAHQEPPAYAD